LGLAEILYTQCAEKRVNTSLEFIHNMDEPCYVNRCNKNVW